MMKEPSQQFVPEIIILSLEKSIAGSLNLSSFSPLILFCYAFMCKIKKLFTPRNHPL